MAPKSCPSQGQGCGALQCTSTSPGVVGCPGDGKQGISPTEGSRSWSGHTSVAGSRLHWPEGVSGGVCGCHCKLHGQGRG